MRISDWSSDVCSSDLAVVEFDVGHALACIFHRLLDRDRHFARLAVAEADLAVAVTDHRQRGEGELATALDRLGDAVDGDELLDHPVVDLVAVVATARIKSEERRGGKKCVSPCRSRGWANN